VSTKFGRLLQSSKQATPFGGSGWRKSKKNFFSVVSTTENPTTSTTHTGTTEEEERKKLKKRRRQKSEKSKVEENSVSDNLGFGSISSENLHGPGYTTFEQKFEAESGGKIVRKFCLKMVFASTLLIVLLR
jgi:hypothetical protein